MAVAVSHRRPRRDREAQIYRVAAQIFYDKGYGATSVEDIAEEVGILKGSLYYYMDSKEDLLFHVIERAHQELTQLLDETLAEGATDDPMDQLERLIKAHTRYVCDNHVTIGVFFNDFKFLSPTRQEEIIGARDSYDHRVQKLLSRARKAGQIDEAVDIPLASMAILGAVNWAYQWYRPGGRLSPDQIGEELSARLLGGVMPRAPHPTKASSKAKKTARADATKAPRTATPSPRPRKTSRETGKPATGTKGT
jgi:AcrR family transcriptional regulator